MNIEDAYYEFPELATQEEKEEMDFTPGDGRVEFVPHWWSEKVGSTTSLNTQSHYRCSPSAGLSQLPYRARRWGGR